jgi:hypothetical protein
MARKVIQLPEGTEHVRFGDLAEIIAEALHAGDDWAIAAARVNLESELKQSVRDGALPVKDALTLGAHTFPIGQALNDGRVLVADLRDYVRSRGIEVRLGSAAPVHFDAALSERPFSSHLLKVADLLAWTHAKRLSLATVPEIGGFEFVQAEALLCAIERHVTATVSPEQAAEIVASSPELSKDRAASSPQTCRWLLGADAHQRWRALLEQAIGADELQLLEFGSKLPIARLQSKANEATGATPALVMAVRIDDGETWKERARERAHEIIERQRERDLYPSQEDVADEIAKEFRQAGTVGAGGKPLTGAYIKRHALKGISSAEGKQLSTSIRRGK